VSYRHIYKRRFSVTLEILCNPSYELGLMEVYVDVCFI
jgi:hypothetical protein